MVGKTGEDGQGHQYQITKDMMDEGIKQLHARLQDMGESGESGLVRGLQLRDAGSYSVWQTSQAPPVCTAKILKGIQDVRLGVSHFDFNLKRPLAGSLRWECALLHGQVHWTDVALQLPGLCLFRLNSESSAPLTPTSFFPSHHLAEWGTFKWHMPVGQEGSELQAKYAAPLADESPLELARRIAGPRSR